MGYGPVSRSVRKAAKGRACETRPRSCGRRIKKKTKKVSDNLNCCLLFY